MSHVLRMYPLPLNYLLSLSFNRIMKFIIFQFQRPSAYFSIEITSGNASGSREQPESHTLFVTMTEVGFYVTILFMHHS